MTKKFELTLEYKRETKGTWAYEAKLAEGQRVSGANTAYLLKSEYPTRPGDKIKVTYEIEA